MFHKVRPNLVFQTYEFDCDRTASHNQMRTKYFLNVFQLSGLELRVSFTIDYTRRFSGFCHR